MPIFTLTLVTTAEAFDEDQGHYEVARILREVATKIEEGWSNFEVLDRRGHRVGEVTW